MFSWMWVSTIWNRNITVLEQEQQQHYAVPPSNNTVSPNHRGVQGCFLTPQWAFLPGMQLLRYLWASKWIPGLDGTFFPPQNRTHLIHALYRGQYLWLFPSLTVSTEVAQHQKRMRHSRLQSACFPSEKTSLDKLQLHEQAKPKSEASIQHQANAKHEDRQKL